MPLIESKRQSMYNNESLQENDLLNGDVEKTNVQNTQHTEVYIYPVNILNYLMFKVC